MIDLHCRFLLGNQGYTLTPNDYILEFSRVNRYFLYPNLNSAENCGLAVMEKKSEMDKEKRRWILGNIFISKFLSIFDWDLKRIGLGIKYK